MKREPGGREGVRRIGVRRRERGSEEGGGGREEVKRE